MVGPALADLSLLEFAQPEICVSRSTIFVRGAIAIRGRSARPRSTRCHRLPAPAGGLQLPDTVCGFTGISEISGVDNFGTLANGGTYDDGRLVQTFTADDGRAVEFDYSAGHTTFSPMIPNGDGTVSQTLTASGLDVRTKAVGGPLLEQGAGRIVIQLTEDADGHTLSATPISVTGPNPNLTGGPRLHGRRPLPHGLLSVPDPDERDRTKRVKPAVVMTVSPPRRVGVTVFDVGGWRG